VPKLAHLTNSRAASACHVKTWPHSREGKKEPLPHLPSFKMRPSQETCPADWWWHCVSKPRSFPAKGRGCPDCLRAAVLTLGDFALQGTLETYFGHCSRVCVDMEHPGMRWEEAREAAPLSPRPEWPFPAQKHSGALGQKSYRVVAPGGRWGLLGRAPWRMWSLS
jgi:hypothetical protein